MMGNKLRKQRLQSDSSSSSSIQSSCSNEKEKSDFCWARGRGRDVGSSGNSTTLQSDSHNPRKCPESHINEESFHNPEVPVTPTNIRSRTRQMQQESGKLYLDLVQCMERSNQAAGTSGQSVLSQGRVSSADAGPCEIKSNTTTKHNGILCGSTTAVTDTFMAEKRCKSGSATKDKKTARTESLRPVMCSANNFNPLPDRMYCSTKVTSSNPQPTYYPFPVLSTSKILRPSVGGNNSSLFSGEIRNKLKRNKTKAEVVGSLATRYGVKKINYYFFFNLRNKIFWYS